ncbi:aminotransferase class I/II-fold pyridoxal phosphate-dependent enzyme [Paenibacillus athensensis]|uniref:Aminotransferase n=1 Tax=Paenibacillus athensensis TaxID=1967502 RepID=A0A4Y8PY19_9BACL|nr:aminotransferase class I/II-fold pyridoxal phosphate-dependent enzyme [Paenibacillus athensensis]MCD1259371.1 aminotransferase class I/II-fold pyridoxal phosphate-dependent enzyme [Paenibacillus athensensis]
MSRNDQSPPYISVQMMQLVQNARSQGLDVIDFTVGNPDLPPPRLLLDIVRDEIFQTANHRYPTGESSGTDEFRYAVAQRYQNVYGVELDPFREVIALNGSKEGAHYLSLTNIEPGDVVIVCEPGYSTYRYSAQIANAEIYSLSLSVDNGFLPDLASIPSSVLERTKLFYVNYPSNPLGATAPFDFYERLLDLAVKYGFCVCNDLAYGEIYYGANRPLSILNVPGAKEHAVEMNSLSKSFNVCGWRIGMLVGNAAVIAKVLAMKQNTDAGIFLPFQKAGAAALRLPVHALDDMRNTYRLRKEALVQGLRQTSFDVYDPEAGMFVWARVPQGSEAGYICEQLLTSCGIACIPGRAYGKSGDDYVRFSLSVPLEQIHIAMQRLNNLWKG